MSAGEAELRAYVQGLCAPRTDEVTQVIRTLVTQNYPSAVDLLSFEVHMEGYEISCVVHFMDSDWTEVWDESLGESGYPGSVDPALVTVPLDLSLFESQLENSWAITVRVFVQWLSDCWSNAGGRKFSRGAYIQQHDSLAGWDLRTGKRVVF